MSNDETMATLFELAITVEELAEDFYLGLGEKFFHLPEISDFWKGMREGETQHVKELENIRDSLAPDQLSLPADPAVLRKVKETLKFSVNDSLNSIRTLEDAYKLAQELEDSEVNVIIKLLMLESIPVDEIKKFVQSELDHLRKLVNLSKTFGNDELRKGIVIGGK